MPVSVEGSEVTFFPGPVDVHAHPRVFDAINPDEFLSAGGATLEGKAGLERYTEVALKSGIVAMLAMPNEAVRLYLPGEDGEHTELIQFPIATADRLRAMQAAVSHEAVIPTGLIFGLDPERALAETNCRVDRTHLYAEFTAVKDECMALKIYGAETTGGNNVDKQFIPEIAGIWFSISPEKPIIMHLEDDDVEDVLSAIGKLGIGDQVPLHIAHVSSRQELEAVMAAKSAGMNVTCEVTPHHLTFDGSLRNEIGMFGCMKPTLKSREDVDFIWENIENIDIFASDCAPHRLVDKEDEAKTTYGVTNHTVMLPTLLQAVEDDKITYEDIYQKFCVKPRMRFNLPHDDSSVRISLEPVDAEELEAAIDHAYGENPWLYIEQAPQMVGRVVASFAGRSLYRTDFGGAECIQPSYTHLLRPKNLKG